MSGDIVRSSRDWLRDPLTSALAWWIPVAAIVLGLFASEAFRSAVWIAALVWMGAACILNARRCGRTHCRYTGPYYLAMIVPVLVIGTGIVSVNIYGWTVFAMVILLGSRLLWWATERAWGKFT